MRRPALVLLIPVLLLAAACGSEDASKSPTGIDLVKVTGDPGKKPKVQFEKPFKVTKTSAKVLSKGSGEKLAEGQQVVVDYVGVNGRDGKQFDSSWDRGQSAPFSLKKGELINGFITGLVGKSVGSRVLVTIPPKDGYGKQGQPEAGIKKSDTLVFVIDVKNAYKPLSMAEGDEVTPPDGLPTVTTDGKGVPTKVSVPKTDPSKELVSETLIQGEGEKITSKSTVNFHYLAVNWRTGKEFDSSWKRGKFENLPLAQTSVKGLAEGLDGSTVGSRVLLVLPPDKGFKQDLPNTDVKKTDTVVFVVDVLGAA